MKNLKQYIQDDCKYRRFREDNPSDRAEAQSLFNELIEACCASSLLTGELEKNNLDYEEDVIMEIVERVRMRKLYFYVYHDIVPPDNLNELKVIALHTFWILKLHPFKWRKECQRQREYPISNYNLNARIALGLFIRGLKLYADSKTIDAAQTAQNVSYVVSLERVSSSVIDTLFYSFMYRDWSKEALMDLAESLIIKE